MDNPNGNYSVEIREPLRGGDDYSERHEEADTPEEVREILAEMDEDESLHSVLYYPPGTDSDPRDVTSRFLKSRRRF
jgi:hypothetical protein